MLRFELSDGDRALPALDVADDVVVIGSSPSARIRLPAEVARPVHARFAGRAWTLFGDAVVGGQARSAGDGGAIGDGVVIALGSYTVRVREAPAGALATEPRRTESLARELVRGLLGDGAAPTLEIERGVRKGARRMLPPPEAKLVIGRGDEATWVILDEDLSRTHAEVRRGWDGVTVVDLGSKNGTRVDGAVVRGEPALLRDGATLALGRVVMRFRDPAERHLRGERAGPAAGAPSRGGAEPVRASRTAWQVPVLVAIAVAALAASIWILVA